MSCDCEMPNEGLDPSVGVAGRMTLLEYVKKLEVENRQLKAELHFIRSLVDIRIHKSILDPPEVFLAKQQRDKTPVGFRKRMKKCFFVVYDDVKNDLGRIRQWLSASPHT